jgi:type VI protein secretion system component VasF
VGLRFHLEQKKREKRSQKLLIWLSFWAACAATAALMLTIALIISKAVN